jgi:NDP-sugar pyrophosphorylase family protein
MVVYRNEGRWDTSNVKFLDGVVIEYDKWHPIAEMAYIDYGLGLFDKRVFERLPPNQPIDLADVYRELVAARSLAGVEVTQRFYEIGSPEGLAEFRTLIAERGSQVDDVH